MFSTEDTAFHGVFYTFGSAFTDSGAETYSFSLIYPVRYATNNFLKS